MQSEVEVSCVQSEQKYPINPSEATPQSTAIGAKPLDGCDESAYSRTSSTPVGDSMSEKCDKKSLDSGKNAVVDETIPTSKTSRSASRRARVVPLNALEVSSEEVERHGRGISANQFCVRWCVNVALQSFREEPWAVNLRRVVFAEHSSPPSEDEPHGKGLVPTNAEIEGSFETPPPCPISNPCEPALEDREGDRESHRSDSWSSKSVLEGGEGNEHSDARGPDLRPRGRGDRSHTPTAASRCGIQLCAVKWSQEEAMVAMRTAGSNNPFITRSELRKELWLLQRALNEVNAPPMSFPNDELLRHIFNVEFVLAPCGGEVGGEGGHQGGRQASYTLRRPIDPLLCSTLLPVVSAVVDHGVNAMALMYGATREMRQLGLIGTPKALGLFPKGIALLMERYLAHGRREAASREGSPPAKAEALSRRCVEAEPVDGVGEGLCRAGEGGGVEYFPPSDPSEGPRFARVEVSFVAFDAKTVVDLLELNNRTVELVLKVDGGAEGGAQTEAFIQHAHAIPVESTNDAFCLLDVGLENFAHTLQKGLFESETNTSLMFSLGLFPAGNGGAGEGGVFMRMLCLAEDQAVQTWLTSSLAAYHHAIPPGKESRAAAMGSVPMPPPLHHQAANVLLPAVYHGNVFTSVMVCVYNSITALLRVNRDLSLAAMGYRMHTTPVLPRREKGGREDRGGGGGGEREKEKEREREGRPPSAAAAASPAPTAVVMATSPLQRSTLSIANPRWGWGARMRSPTKRTRGCVVGIPLGEGDKDYFSAQQNRYGGGDLSPNRLDPPAALPSVDISIVVVDTSDHLRVVLNGSSGASVAELCQEVRNSIPKHPQQFKGGKEKGKRKGREERGFRYTVATRPTSPRPISPQGWKGRLAARDADETAKACGEDADSRSTSSLSESTLTLSPSLLPTSRLSERGFDAATGASSSVGFDAPEAAVGSPKPLEDPLLKDGEESKSEEEAGRPPFEDISCPIEGNPVDDPPRNPFENISELIETSKFYTNVIQEEAVAASHVSHPGASLQESPYRRTSSGSENHGGCAAASDALAASPCGVGSFSPLVHHSEKNEGEEALPTNLPSEAEDLESLLNEFSMFFRHSYENERRLKQLEAELKSTRKELARVSGITPDQTPVPTAKKDASGGAMSIMIDPRVLLERMEEKLEDIGPPAMREHLRAHIEDGKAWGSSVGMPPQGSSSQLTGERTVALDGQSVILNLWEAMIRHNKEVEQDVRWKAHTKCKGMITQLSKRHEALLLEWVKGYENTIHTLETENACLRQLNRRKGDTSNRSNNLDRGTLPCPSPSQPPEASKHRISIPFSSSEILAQHKALFDELIYEE
ncbi:unnamed protein product [Phytomonas sp. EM1]|nr:unnamed protein product [Phytomonas sp. EM1]|eukprot:CCW61683.1 unnamed protein product [Phytomonas sp. isolate EM1]